MNEFEYIIVCQTNSDEVHVNANMGIQKNIKFTAYVLPLLPLFCPRHYRRPSQKHYLPVYLTCTLSLVALRQVYLRKKRQLTQMK